MDAEESQADADSVPPPGPPPLPPRATKADSAAAQASDHDDSAASREADKTDEQATSDAGAFDAAVDSLDRTLEKIRGCSPDERTHLREDLEQLRRMVHKLAEGRVELVVFGEISTGKSALINALVGQDVRGVDVQGGWTKEIWRVDWDGCGYCVPGLADSQVVLVDTPGLNEVGGPDRGEMAREAAQQADLILFVTDSDLNDTEFAALTRLADAHKPIIVVLNKMDLYDRHQRQRLLDVLTGDRLADLVPAENVVMTSADPRETEYVIESPDGAVRREWRTPEPDVTELKVRILEVLQRDGLALVTLNAAMYAADKSDRIASLRVEMRSRAAMKTILGFAAVKAVAVALNPWAIADVVGGSVVDASMVLALARIYGLDLSWRHARTIAVSIVHAAGWVMLGEATVSIASSMVKAVSFGTSIAFTAVPQGAAAGFGSYIVGLAARYYFEHGSSWGPKGPKAIVRKLLDETDKHSVIEHLKDEIRKKIQWNAHAGKNDGKSEPG